MLSVGPWGSSKIFSTKSVCEWLEIWLAGCDYRWVWKSKMPFKIQFFLWQLSQDAVLTRDVMKRRKWPGNPRYSVWNEWETSHLFFLWPHARTVWRSVSAVLGTEVCPSNITFGSISPGCMPFYLSLRKFIRLAWQLGQFEIVVTGLHLNSSGQKLLRESVFAACASLCHWAGLHRDATGEVLNTRSWDAESYNFVTDEDLRYCSQVGCHHFNLHFVLVSVPFRRFYFGGCWACVLRLLNFGLILDV